ncbi:MAG: gliding motility-associated C-terminal domain-containing protein [Bacteroidia bacterium]|nr:gliding motility-associated C-terminal domain-containing protein [Bacteroidia bacterium]
MRPCIRYIGLLFGCFWASLVFGTHIMGGELYYKHVSDSTYTFSLVYYVDCQNGSPAAISSDAEAIFGFFNATTGDFIEKVEITRNPPIRVTKLNYSCVTQLPNACVDRYDYTFTKAINPGKDGLIVAFQRCCRNHTITNLIDPGGTGMTIFARIPPVTEVPINSNPYFNDNPPNFLCNNAPLIFDHSASDMDGDSLVYDLFIPYEGATSSVPRPSKPSKPPYKKVAYTSAYNVSDLMGGVEKLEIDRHTGKLTVWPDKVGQYVVGIRVSEYRDGEKIGETLRDYQFNVLNCVFGVQANFEVPELDCSDSVVTFTNLSKNALDYVWNFDVDNNLVGESDQKHPTITYSKKGTYQVKLLAKNKDCADSITKSVTIGQEDSIQASFSLTPDTACAGSMFYVVNTSDDTPDWFWDLGQGAGEEHNKKIDSFRVEEPGVYDIRLRILDSANCLSEKVAVQSLVSVENRSFESEFEVDFPDKCNPGTMVLTRSDNIPAGWSWEITNQSSDYSNKSPIELSGLDPGKIQVRLKPGLPSERCVSHLPTEKEIEIPGLDAIQYEVQAYNVFTPDGDGLNDCYSLDKDGDCFDLTMVIYNRWGEVVFDSKESQSQCWDGYTPNGDLYPSGTYFGIIDISNKELEYSETLSVTVTLIR